MEIPKEPERCFLADIDDIPEGNYTRKHIQQCYLPNTGEWAIRSRKTVKNGLIAYSVTFKRNISKGVCYEIENAVDKNTWLHFVTASGAILKKERIEIPYGEFLIEVDLFEDNLLPSNKVKVEIELPSIDHEIKIPDWLGTEVTGNPEYSNRYLFEKLKTEAKLKHDS